MCEDDESNSSSDVGTAEESNDLIEMKRRFTLVTAEEPIPLTKYDLNHHPLIVEHISQLTNGI